MALFHANRVLRFIRFFLFLWCLALTFIFPPFFEEVIRLSNAATFVYQAQAALWVFY